MAIPDLQSPGKPGLVQVHQQTNWKVSKLDLFMVETAAGNAKVRGKPWQELSQVAEAWNRCDEGAGDPSLVGDVQWHPKIP